MKNVYSQFKFLLMVLLLIPVIAFGQKKEIPITTKSKEALKLFVDGREKLENFESTSAIELLDLAIQKDPGFAMAYLHRAQAGGGSKVFKENMDKATNLVSTVSDGEKLLIQYYQAISNGENIEGKELLDKLLTLYPTDKRVQSMAGQYYYGNKDFNSAVKHYSKSIELDKKYAPAYNMKGYSHIGLLQYDEAEKCMENYIKLIPDKAAGYDSYAELLLKRGKYDESIEQYKKALQLDPGFRFSFLGLGHNYCLKGDCKEAKKYFEEVYKVSKSPGQKINALYWQSVAYVYGGDVVGALAIFDEIRKLAEQEKYAGTIIQSYAYQGFLSIEMGNTKEGSEYYKKAIDLVETIEMTEKERENYRTISSIWCFYALSACNELEKADEKYAECIKRIEKYKDQGQEALLNLVLEYHEFMKGNFDKAIEISSKADQENPLTWYYTAMAYNAKGDSQNARKFFEKIVTSTNNSLELAIVRKAANVELNR